MSSIICFSTVSKARCFDGSPLELILQTIHHEHVASCTFDIFSDDEKRTITIVFQHIFEQRFQTFYRRDFLFMNQNERVVEFNGHAFSIGDEVWREISTIELHPFDEFNAVSVSLPSSMLMTPILLMCSKCIGLHGFTSITVVEKSIDFFDGVNDIFSQFLISIGRNKSNILDLIAINDGL